MPPPAAPVPLFVITVSLTTSWEPGADGANLIPSAEPLLNPKILQFSTRTTATAATYSDGSVEPRRTINAQTSEDDDGAGRVDSDTSGNARSDHSLAPTAIDRHGLANNKRDVQK